MMPTTLSVAPQFAFVMPTLLAQGELGAGAMIGIAFLCLFLLVFLGVFARYFGLWIQSKMTRAGIGFVNLVMMTIRKVNPSIIVRAKIMATQAGLTGISTRALEAHYLAGGDVTKVIRALVAAHRADLNMDWQTAQAIDLAGRDVLRRGAHERLPESH